MPQKKKESRYFWPDGSRKLYCVKNGCGPFKDNDTDIIVFGQTVKSAVCKKCKVLYYESKSSEFSGYKTSGRGLESHIFHHPSKRSSNSNFFN